VELIGKTPINPFLFYSGKIAGYILWILLLLYFLGLQLSTVTDNIIIKYIVYFLVVIALILIFFSLLKLGRSTRLGIPTDSTIFKNTGIYSISRNPMYVGFNMLTISSILIFMNPYIAIFGIYSIYVYHKIILSEENFLEDRFGQDYKKYKLTTKRYL